tara:strand:+ start:12 stop:839 length:828 start_codon:yes stop_codon:yes gene_type:complete
MVINAFKMDGLGNDFIIIDCRDEKINLTKEQIIKLCDRSFLGCDQLILIYKSARSDAELIFYNSDGSESAACGNGTRCVAYLISKEANKKIINLSTKSGNLDSKILGLNLVETRIGQAKTSWMEIPISRDINTKNLGLEIQDRKGNILKGGTAVNVGNPHTVFFIDDLNKFNLEKIGPTLENNNLFPERCNITLAKVENRKKISVKVWERGAGLTKACGSAACATAFAAKINNLIDCDVEIGFELGNLSINVDDKDFVKMKGPVSDIKKIEIKLK